MMLDEKDLRAIASIMDEKIDASESRMKAYMKEEISASESRMKAYTKEEISASESRMKAYTTEVVRTSVSESESRMMKHMDEKIDASESRMKAYTKEETGAAEARIMAMMEAYFDPKFDLLAEQIQLIEEKLIPAEALEDLEDRVDVLEAAVKRHSRDIELLRKAQ